MTFRLQFNFKMCAPTLISQKSGSCVKQQNDLMFYFINSTTASFTQFGTGVSKDWESCGHASEIPVWNSPQVNRFTANRLVSWLGTKEASSKGSVIHKKGWVDIHRLVLGYWTIMLFCFQYYRIKKGIETQMKVTAWQRCLDLSL